MHARPSFSPRSYTALAVASLVLIASLIRSVPAALSGAAQTQPEQPSAMAEQDEKPPRQDPDKEFLAEYSARYMNLIAPVEEHELFQRLAGEWTRTSRYLLNPDADGKTRLTRSVVYGGRFLLETEQGDGERSGGGTAVLGFNRVLEHYEHVSWHDMTTGIVFATGRLDPETGSLVFSWRFKEPVLDYWIQARLIWRFPDPDRIEQTFYEANGEADPDDPDSWRRTMEIVEQRAR
jgi:hypothetical protein